MEMTTLPPPRRIVASNQPLPPHLAGVTNAEPAVQIVSDNLLRHAELDGHASRGTVFTHKSIPTCNSGLEIDPIEVEGGGVVIPKGANVRFNDLGPGARVPMVRRIQAQYQKHF